MADKPRRRRFCASLPMGAALIVALLPFGQKAAAAPPRPGASARVAQNAIGVTPLGAGPQLAAPAGETLPTPAPPSRGFTIPLASPDGEDTIELSSDDGLVSLVVRDAPLRHVMSLLATANQLSLVFASATDVPVTATLDRVPLEQAMNSLLLTNGFTWTLADRVIYVTSIADGSDLPAGVQGRRVAVLELDFASAADLDPGVKGMLSPVGNSWVLESNSTDNRRTKEAIVVEDVEANLQRIERFVCEADQPPRQVLIEAHLLEVLLNKDDRAGVNFDSLARLGGSQLRATAFALASPRPSSNSATSTPSFFVQSAEGDLGLLIEALISTTDAKTLAKPRVLAVSGQESTLQIGRRLGFNVIETTQNGETLQNVEFLDVGVVLTVTPRVTRDGRVLMRIEPEVSSGQVNPTTGLPEKDTTEVRTDVVLADGQGMIIGGLIQEQDTESVSRVPVLSKIPYAGFLFERKEAAKRRSELIVALRPRILPYSPLDEQRNAHELARTEEPLLHGPLCRRPRPYEARLPGTLSSENCLRCLQETDGCPAPGLHHHHTYNAAPSVATAARRPRIRRLPPIDASTRLTRRPATRLIY